MEKDRERDLGLSSWFELRTKEGTRLEISGPYDRQIVPVEHTVDLRGEIVRNPID
jgi:hypothetical protein